VVDDGSDAPDPSPDAVAYEDALAAHSPERDFAPRSGDDIYILYTGGTTGMPKGVVWRHEDVFYALGGGTDPLTNSRIEDPSVMVGKGAGGPMTFLPVAPLMHGATQWAVMGQSFVGSKIVLMARFDPHQVWSLVEAEKVNSVMITGDAMGKPLIESLDDVGTSHDLSSLVAVVSSAALFSAPVKDQFFAHLPNILITDAIGSSEGGNNGMTIVSPGQTAMKSGPTVHLLGKTVVFDEDRNLVEPGSGTIGKIARSGDIPQGYYNDPKKTAEVFVTVQGTRYVMPGDYATVEADGSITLLGRGSIVINSGGEKIFPEEVESAVRSHPDVMDAIVCGAPDERWGQTVAAIIQPRVGRRAPSLESIQEHCRSTIAGYKLPRRLHVVETVERSPSGKPDYTWATAIVTAGDAASAP
jgi:3-oxocholest-4-en-26-oate---CoA ligase